LFFCCFLAFFVNNPKKGSVFFQKMTDFTHNQFRLPCTWYESTQHTFQLHICYFEFEQLLRIKIWNFFHFFSPRATQDDFFFQKRTRLLFKLKKEYFLVLIWAMLLKKLCAGSCFIYMMLINFLVLIFFSFLSFLRFFNGPKSKDYISTSFFFLVFLHCFFLKVYLWYLMEFYIIFSNPLELLVILFNYNTHL